MIDKILTIEPLVIQKKGFEFSNLNTGNHTL